MDDDSRDCTSETWSGNLTVSNEAECLQLAECWLNAAEEVLLPRFVNPQGRTPSLSPSVTVSEDSTESGLSTEFLA